MARGEAFATMHPMETAPRYRLLQRGRTIRTIPSNALQTSELAEREAVQITRCAGIPDLIGSIAAMLMLLASPYCRHSIRFTRSTS